MDIVIVHKRDEELKAPTMHAIMHWRIQFVLTSPDWFVAITSKIDSSLQGLTMDNLIDNSDENDESDNRDDGTVPTKEGRVESSIATSESERRRNLGPKDKEFEQKRKMNWDRIEKWIGTE